MFWNEKGQSRYLETLLDLLKALASAPDLEDLVVILNTSPVIKDAFDCVAIWHFADGGGITLKGADRNNPLAAVEISRFFSPEGSPNPMETQDLEAAGFPAALLCPLQKEEGIAGVIGFLRRRREGIKPKERTLSLIVAAEVSRNLESISLRKELISQNEILRLQKEYIEEIINSIKSGILVVDDEGDVLTANPFAGQVLGLPSDAIVGRNLDELLPGLREMAAVDQFEGAFSLPNGHNVHIGFSQSKLESPQGLNGNIILFRDLSEIIDLRNQLRRKQYFSAVGETTSWIVHELKTPLFAITSIARMLLAQLEATDQKKLIESVLKESERLARLLEEILHYGKPLHLQIERISLNVLLSEIRDQIEASASQAGCTIDIPVSPPIECGIDRDRMKQVFHNIIKNSIDASAKQISITIGNGEDGVLLIFRDDGKGVKEDHLAKVFRPFFTTKKTGTGLGLPICRKIIEEHGGTVALKSEAGQGTEITITLKP